ncbi:unnamed protein product, partial [Lampetra planeri]
PAGTTLSFIWSNWPVKLFRERWWTPTPAFHLTLINVCFSNLQARGAAAGREGLHSVLLLTQHISQEKQRFSRHKTRTIPLRLERRRAQMISSVHTARPQEAPPAPRQRYTGGKED